VNKLKSYWAAGTAVAIGISLCAMAQGKQPAPIPNIAGKVQTVNGLIDPSALGATLMHEHIFIDFKQTPPMIPPPTNIVVIQPPSKPAPGDKPAQRGLTDFDESLNAIMEFKNGGGGTIVDVSNFGLTRDPLALQLVSRASGLNVVMGAGWYMHQYHPSDMDQLTVQQLTDIVVRDITVGAQGTDIRSGIIGEVGVGDFEDFKKHHPMEPNVIKSVRASARAARITGAPMSIHNFEGLPEMMQVLDIIQSEGVDLHRVVMSHTGGRPPEEMEAIFKRGAYVEWDYMGQAPLPAENGTKIIDSVAAMIKAGHAAQIVLSHDICTQAQLKINGGGGYTYINTVIIPGLKAQGVSDATIHQIAYENPARALTFVAPQSVIHQP
jgi:phosphotriesterase-related protein